MRRRERAHAYRRGLWPRIALVARERDVEAEQPGRVEAVGPLEATGPGAQLERSAAARLARAALHDQHEPLLVRLDGAAERDRLADWSPRRRALQLQLGHDLEQHRVRDGT